MRTIIDEAPISASAERRRRDAKLTVNAVSLVGRRVLIVEDNIQIAAAIAWVLKAQGAEIIGPVRTVQDALALIAGNERIDGAALDVNLRGKMVIPSPMSCARKMCRWSS